MTRTVLILLILIAYIACNNSEKEIKNTGQTKINKSPIQSDTKKESDKELNVIKLSYKNLVEIIQDKKSHAWVNLHNDTSSCALHFNLHILDTTVCIEYSPECWFMFPFRVSDNKITVYWNKNIDSKYDFNIVKVIKKVSPKYENKPFMILNLANDTTMDAIYPFPELLKKLNTSDKARLLFPDKYIVSKTYM